jgi:hypothetical protein
MIPCDQPSLITLHCRLFTSDELRRIQMVAGKLGYEIRMDYDKGEWLMLGLYMDSPDAEAFFSLAEVDV